MSKTQQKLHYQDIPATQHDVMAVVYYMRMKLEQMGMGDVAEFVHLGLTSEDVTNTARALALSDALGGTPKDAVYRPVPISDPEDTRTFRLMFEDEETDLHILGPYPIRYRDHLIKTLEDRGMTVLDPDFKE